MESPGDEQPLASGIVQEISILHLFGEGIRSTDVVELSFDAARGVSGRSKGSDPSLTLPPLSLTVLPSLLFEVVLELSFAPAPDVRDTYIYTQLYYQLEGAAGFSEDFAISRKLAPGDRFQMLHFRFRAPCKSRLVRLRLDPSNVPGSFVISSAKLIVMKCEKKKRSEPSFTPVCISNYGRTGSTLLMKLLSLHPMVMCVREHPYELNIISYFLKFARLVRKAPFAGKQADLMENIWGESLCSPVGFQQWLDNDVFSKYYSMFLSTYLPDFLSLCDVSRFETAPFYIEKLPGYFMEDFTAVFPNGKIILLFRDPHKTYLSIKKFESKNEYKAWSWGKANDLELISAMMSFFAAQIQCYTNDPEQRIYLPVRYEDIVASPRGTMEKICTFIGLPFSEFFAGEVAGYFSSAPSTREFQQHQTSGGIQESRTSSWEKIPEVEKNLFYRCRKIFDTLGYPMP